MAITRDHRDPYSTVEHTGKIEFMPNTTNLIKGAGYFDVNYTNQRAIEFDVISSTLTLMDSKNRDGDAPEYGSGQNIASKWIGLGEFQAKDQVRKRDYAGIIVPGTPDVEAAKEEAVTRKLNGLKARADYTQEWLLLQAIKGNCVTPDGTVLANMFDLLGITQTTVDFDFQNTADLGAKCRDVRSAMQLGLRTGGAFTGNVPMAVDRQFFDGFVAHDSVRTAYMNWGSATEYQSAMDQFKPWGISAFFSFGGLTLFTYEHEFAKRGGATEAAIAAKTGHVIPTAMGESLLKVWYGGSEKMSVASGSEMFLWEYADPKDEYVDLEAEFKAVAYCEKPGTLVKAVSTT